MSARVGPLTKEFPSGMKGVCGPACYLEADTLGELHFFAGKVGASFAKFSRAKNEAGGRYILHERQRTKAIELGAIEVEE